MLPSAPEAPFLSVRDLTLQYKTERHLVTATREVSFQVERADRLILLGPSGCGKSTILKAIGGFIKPAGGSISLSGVQVKKPGADRAFVFQEFDQLLPWKTALGNIVFAIRETRKTGAKEAAEEARGLLRKVNLAQFADSYPHALSGGMKQRVAIARCLALKSKIILMDEPFASLDALTRQQMQEDLLALWADTKFTLIFVTHSIDEALMLGSRIVLLSPHPGRVVDEISVDWPGADSRTRPEYAALKEKISRTLFKDKLNPVI
ncbi:ABC transporter ATP-binding protein [Treponema endosymbiont of Eucomonympha sp.]|uniref:ABC transporter ATP-binding protein n=1 Tax=Treponema endosymbiont of Eucomonympha sp. TaxID=1580831 RepID=UPI00078453CD|nr:ABC transporter ATP-binding protein [Treponema endosymbiont of Eucomonympha sp.]